MDTVGLEALWEGDEASGDRIDSHGSNTLTESSTVGAAAGKIGGARDYERTEADYHTIASNANITFGNEDFTIWTWLYHEARTGAAFAVFGKVTAGGGTEYSLDYNGAVDRLIFSVGNGSTAQDVTSNNLGAMADATWYLAICWHDSVANTVNIQVNNGTPDSAAFSDGCANLSAPFAIGRQGGFGTNYWDGLIDQVGIGRRVYTTQERTDLWGAGNGLAYPFSAATGGGPLAGAGRLLNSNLIRGRLVA